MVEKTVLGGELSRREVGVVSTKPTHKVNVEIVRSVQQIGQIGIGPISGSIQKAEVEYDGQVVTEVPEGEDFKLAITYSAQNPGFSVKPTDPGWTICFTAKSTDGLIKGYEHAWMYSASSSGVDRIEPLGPMPDHDITIRVKLWGTQDYVITPPYSPPENQW